MKNVENRATNLGNYSTVNVELKMYTKKSQSSLALNMIKMLIARGEKCIKIILLKNKSLNNSLVSLNWLSTSVNVPMLAQDS